MKRRRKRRTRKWMMKNWPTNIYLWTFEMCDAWSKAK